MRATPREAGWGVLKGKLGQNLFSFCPLAHYSRILCRLLQVFSPNEFCISKLISCQIHLRLMTGVCVAIKHTARMCPLLSTSPIKQLSQICRSAPCSALIVGSHRVLCKMTCGGVGQGVVGAPKGNADLSCGGLAFSERRSCTTRKAREGVGWLGLWV